MAVETEGDQNAGESPRRRFKRKLTPFLCQEMLYDYATGVLDVDRAADIAEFIANDKPSQDALESVRRGLEYSEALSKAELSPELFERLSEAENLRSLIRRYMDWNEWPETVRLSASAIAISILIAGIVTAIPWQKIPQFGGRSQKTVVLADIPEKTAPGTEADTNAPEAEVEVSQSDEENLGTSGDEHDDGSEARVALAQVQREAEAEAAPAPRPAPAVAATKPVPNPQPIQAAVGETTDVKAGSAIEAPASKPEKPGGFVYRAFMTLSDLDTITPEIVDKLVAFGSEKAGEVPLGWRKTSGGELGSYFHFVVPEKNQEKMMEMLRAYGPVRISKDPHPRVMPPGQIRFILWIEPAPSSGG